MNKNLPLDPEPWESVNHGGRGETYLTYDDMKFRPREGYEQDREAYR